MIAHLREREKNLEPFGWSPEDAEWVALVCLHSGVFTRSAIHRLFQRPSQPGVSFRQEPRGTETCRVRAHSRHAPRGPHPGLSDHPQGHLPGAGGSQHRHRKFPDPGAYLRRLLSLDYVIEHPALAWLPTEEEKVWYCEDIGIPTEHLPKRIYTGATGAVTRYFNLKLPVAGGPTTTFVYVDPGNGTSTEMRHWGWAHEHLWADMRKRNIRIHVAAIGVNPVADKRARAVLNGWAREGKRVQTGSPHEAALKKELDELSKALDTFDSDVLARYGGFTKAGRRYRALKSMLAKTVPHDIRIDTFEIWRSERIYPEGVQLYEDRV